MAAPSFRSAGLVGYTSRTTLPLTLPSGVASGDGMVAVVSVDGDRSATLNTPTGWTRLSIDYDATIAATLAVDVAPFGATAPTYTWGGARVGTAGAIGAWRGVAAASWYHGFARATGTSRAPAVTGAVTDSADETVLWGVFQLQSPTAEPSALPASFTSRIAHSSESTATVADRAYASPTSPGALAGTLGQSVRWIAWTLALRSPSAPAASGSTSISAAAAVEATGTKQAVGSSDISLGSSVSATGAKQAAGSANVAAAATVEAAGIKHATGTTTITLAADVSASGVRDDAPDTPVASSVASLLTPDRLATQQAAVSVRHVTMCDPGDPGAIEVLGKHFRGDWGINGVNGWQTGSYSLRLGEEGDFSLELPNTVGSDGRRHLDRLAITRIGRARPLPGGLMEYDGGSYRPGDEWFEIWEDGADRPAFVGTPTKAAVTKTKITVTGWDGMWLLKKTRETQAGFWNHSPREVIEHYSGLWGCAYADDMRESLADRVVSGPIDAGGVVANGVSISGGEASFPAPTRGGFANHYLAPSLSRAVQFGDSPTLRAEATVLVDTGNAARLLVGAEGRYVPGPLDYFCALRISATGRYSCELASGGFIATSSFAPAGTHVALAIEVRPDRVCFYADGVLLALLPHTGYGRPVVAWVEATVATTRPPVRLRSLLLRACRAFMLRGAAKGDARLPGAPTSGGLYAQYFDASDEVAKRLPEDAMFGPQKDFVPRVEPVAFARASPVDWQVPGIPSNNFAVRWSGAIYLELARSDRQVSIAEFWSAGRCRVSIAGFQIIDFPTTSAAGPALRAILGSESGWYPIVIEATYRDGGSGGGLQLTEGPIGATAIAPASILSPYGVVNEQVRNDSHSDALKAVAETFGYQITCEPRSLESGEFPGQVIPRIRQGVDTGFVLDEPAAWNLSDTVDAEGVADAWVADAAGIATTDGSGQLTAEMINFDEATRHLGLITESEALSEISQKPLLEQRLRSLIALSSAPWEEVSVDADGYRDRVDIWPLPSTGTSGETRLFDWGVGDGIRLFLPSLGVVDEAPRQIMGITRDFNPNALKPPRAAFRQRPRDLAATLRVLKQKAVVPQRNPQGSLQLSAGSLGSSMTAVAPDEYSRAWVPAAAGISRAEVAVLFKSGSARYDLEVNGVVAVGGITQIGTYDVTAAVPSARGYVYARLVGAAGESWGAQLQVTAHA